MKLYPHQVRGLEETKDMNRVAYYWDMGTGKTFVGAEKMMRLGAKINLVVCQKSKIRDWYEHFSQNYPINTVILDLTKPSNYEAVRSVINDGVDHGNIFIGIINYELVWRRPELMHLKDFALLLDESSLIQNENAQRSRFILRMHPKNVILLSGTPTGGKYENLWSQMKLLGWDISKKTYWNQYIEVEYLDTIGGRSIPIVTGYKKVDRLKRKMAEHGCRFLKTDEVMDLPEQNYQKIWCDPSKEYKTFKKHRLVTIGGHWVDYCDESGHMQREFRGGIELCGDTTLTRMLYERQLCGQYSKDKLNAFKDLLESTNDRLIVFYNFTAELEAMQSVMVSTYGEGQTYRKCSIVNGDLKALNSYEKYADSVTFVQYQAGAMGLNLQKANKIIYFSLPLSSELFEQSKKRIHRIGQERPCFYYIMMVRGSIEEKILRTLEMRKDYTEKLFEKENFDED